MKKITIVIPTLNEEAGLDATIKRIRFEELKNQGYEIGILVVDSNSKDDTVKIAKSYGAKVINESRLGYGRAYKTGFENAKGDIIVTTDADDTYPLDDLLALLKLFEQEEIDFMTTNRFGYPEKGAMSFSHGVGNWGLTFFTNLLFGIHIKDSQSGMWIFKREILEKINLTSDGMPLSEEIKIEAFKKVKSKEVPIKYRKRIGEVVLNAFKDGIKNISFLFVKRFKFNRR